MTRVYFTKNTEYHVHEGICVRVLRRADGRRLSDHGAVGATLMGGVRFPATSSILSSIRTHAGRGDVLVFTSNDEMTMSSPIEKTYLLDQAGRVMEEDDEDVSTWRRRLA
jgi:hypothetical protein